MATFAANSSLHRLDLSRNNIGTEGAATLATALTAHPHGLTHVALAHNVFRRLGLAPLLRSLLACPLHALTLSLGCVLLVCVLH